MTLHFLFSFNHLCIHTFDFRWHSKNKSDIIKIKESEFIIEERPDTFLLYEKYWYLMPGEFKKVFEEAKLKSNK